MDELNFILIAECDGNALLRDVKINTKICGIRCFACLLASVSFRELNKVQEQCSSGWTGGREFAHHNNSAESWLAGRNLASSGANCSLNAIVELTSWTDHPGFYCMNEKECLTA